MKFFTFVKRLTAKFRRFLEERKERSLFYEVYYINGSEELPPPLGAEEEKRSGGTQSPPRGLHSQKI